jgi:flagellar hook protein FlgE
MDTDLITALDQFSGTMGGADPTIDIVGVAKDGTAVNSSITITAASTVSSVLTDLNALFSGSTFTLNTFGELTMTDSAAGYSQAAITDMTYNQSGTGDDALTIPTFFDLTEAGGNDTKTFSSTIYDSFGTQHNITGKFVKTDTANTWDLVMPAISGELSGDWSIYDFINSTTFNRRISGIEFSSDGSYNGLSSPTESLTFGVQFIAGTTQSITVDLGTSGLFTGLTQFASAQSTAAVSSQDGYTAGELSGVSIDSGGMIVGTFTNGIKADLAALQMATFQNPGGLEAVANSYYSPSANSGDPQETMAATGGAGSLTSKSLEKSNVDVATEFVNLMQAQNGYQSNARTIRVANDMLRELTNLIR